MLAERAPDNRVKAGKIHTGGRSPDDRQPLAGCQRQQVRLQRPEGDLAPEQAALGQAFPEDRLGARGEQLLQVLTTCFACLLNISRILCGAPGDLTPLCHQEMASGVHLYQGGCKGAPSAHKCVARHAALQGHHGAPCICCSWQEQPGLAQVNRIALTRAHLRATVPKSNFGRQRNSGILWHGIHMQCLLDNAEYISLSLAIFTRLESVATT